VIDRDLSKNILVLTGYNGVGKSRIISMIFEAACLVRGVDSPINRVGWVANLQYVDDLVVRAVKMPGDGTDGLREYVTSIIETNITLEQLYLSVDSFVKKKKSFTNIKKNAEGTENAAFGCSGVGALSDVAALAFGESVEVVAYIDEQIYFSYEREVADSVFTGKTNIDKTLYTLFFDFLGRQADSNEEAKKLVFSLFDEYMAKHKDFDFDKAEKFVSARLTNEELFGASHVYEKHPVFVELNKFFKLTNRQIVWANGNAAMQVDGVDLVPWIAFSKGEKTLVALLMTSYLYGGSASFVFDEPDLSLHMEWQKMLLPALLALAPAAQFIISTHSPFMVMNTNSEQIINLAKYHKEV
jgi:predicted ATPase